jgi:hypothetical protein
MATMEAAARLDCVAFFGAARAPAPRTPVANRATASKFGQCPLRFPVQPADQRATTGEQAGRQPPSSNRSAADRLETQQLRRSKLWQSAPTSGAGTANRPSASSGPDRISAETCHGPAPATMHGDWKSEHIQRFTRPLQQQPQRIQHGLQRMKIASMTSSAC